MLATTTAQHQHQHQSQQQQQQQDPSPIAAAAANHAAAASFIEQPPPTIAQRDAQFAQAVQNAASSGVREWSALLHLAPLASQYHLSPYSIIKYGPQGSPFPYIPLTLQQPQLVIDTMAKQRQAERVQHQLREQQQQQPNHSHDDDDATAPAVAHHHHHQQQQQQQQQQQPNGFVAASEQQQHQHQLPSPSSLPAVDAHTTAPANSTHHDNALAAANAHAHASGNPPVKTSDSHPINISTLIPPHLIPVISDSIFASASSQSSAPAQPHQQQQQAPSTLAPSRQHAFPSSGSSSNSNSNSTGGNGERLAKRQSSRTPLLPQGVQHGSTDASGEASAGDPTPASSAAAGSADDNGEQDDDDEDGVEEDGIGLGEKRKRSLSRLDASVLPVSSTSAPAPTPTPAAPEATPTGLPASASTDSCGTASSLHNLRDALPEAEQQDLHQGQDGTGRHGPADASNAPPSSSGPAAALPMNTTTPTASPPPSARFVRLPCAFDLAHAVCDQPELHNVPAPPEAPHPVIAAQAATRAGATSVCEDPEGAVEAAKRAVAEAKAARSEQSAWAAAAAAAVVPSLFSAGAGVEGGGAAAGAGAGAGPFASAPQQQQQERRRIGNLLLSSCPGKKVRLTGPVRGRGAICRSLPSDLARMRSLGIRALVCCLDDDELAFLGAPWPEYARVAREAQLEVVRIPIAEGFAPSSVRELDERVGEVIVKWSMQGCDVLVHCRGGVGRAGLFACAWMLKMGLVREGAGQGPGGGGRRRKGAAAMAPGAGAVGTRSATPQRVRNGTVTPAANASPFLAGIDAVVGGGGGHDDDDGGMPTAPGLLLPEPLELELGPAAAAGGLADALTPDDQARGRNASPTLCAVSGSNSNSNSEPGSPSASKDAQVAAAANRLTASSERELLARQQRVLRTVERLIRTIRTRRSPKAIETAEQVKFLVDYVSYLEDSEDNRLVEGQSSAGPLAAHQAMDQS